MVTVSLSYPQNKLDSLEQKLKDVTGKDSVDIMNKLGLDLAYSDIKKAEFYSLLALDKSRQMRYAEGELSALINVGYSHYDHNRMDSSFYFFKKAVELAEEIGNDKGLGSAHNALGNGYKKIDDFPNAIKHYKESLHLHERNNNVSQMTAALNNIGRALTSISAFNEGTEYLLRALELNLENGFERKAALNLLGLAQIKMDQQEEEVAMDYLLQVKEMANLRDDLYIQTDLFNQLIYISGKLEKYSDASHYYEQCLSQYKAYGKSPAVPKHNYADNLFQQGRLVEAEQVALESLEAKREQGNVLSQSYTLNLLADIYEAKGDLNKALAVSMEALQIVKQKKAKPRERKTYLDISDILQKQGQFELALDYRLKHDWINDSIFNAQKSAQQQAMLTLFETEQKQQQIEIQQAEISIKNIQADKRKTQLISLVVGAFLLFIFSGTVFWSYINTKKIKARIQQQNEQLTQLNQTKDKFFSIIAHDLRSPLLGLESVGEQMDYYLKEDKTDELKNLSGQIEGTAKNLTELLDNLLNWALLQNGMIPYDPEAVDLKQEIDSVFQLLYAFASVKNISLVNQIDAPCLVNADKKAVNTILRNLISNALKFTDSGGRVSVNVKTENQLTTIEINDTGTGISAELIPTIFDLQAKRSSGTQGEKGTGLGLVLCKELVELNKGTINVLSELGKGSSFVFQLPTT